MKKPFTPLHNEFIEALGAAQLSGPQYAIVLVVSRYSHGFGTSRTRLTQAKLSSKTGYAKRTVRRALAELVEMNIVEIHEPAIGRRSALMGLNSKVGKWSVGGTGQTSIGSRREDSTDLSTGRRVDKSDPSSKTVEGTNQATLRGQGRPLRGDRVGHSEWPDQAGLRSEKTPKETYNQAAHADLKKTNKETLIKETLIKENNTKKDDVLSPFKKGSIPETEREGPSDETHYVPDESFRDAKKFRGARVVYAYRALYGEDPQPGDLKFAAAKLAGLLPAVSGPRKRRDLEGALILAARQLRHDIALGREVKNPWGLVWSLVPDHLEAAKEINFRIAHGAYPDDPVSYVWDSDNAVLRANKRREEFLRWMDANEGKAG